MKKYVENTIRYYENNADEYIKNTVNCDMSEVQEPFLKLLNKGDKILDLGCGTGRDSKIFSSLGYVVTGVDGSPKLASYASEMIGCTVRCISFLDLDYAEEFDGVWACASLLHVNKDDMPEIIKKIRIALKPEGIFFCCFKYGDQEYIKEGRSFNNYDEDSIKAVLNHKSGFKIIKTAITTDVRKDRPDEKWLNILAVRMN